MVSCPVGGGCQLVPWEDRRMNATLNQYYDGLEFNFAVNRSTSPRAATNKPSGPTYRRRKASTPQLFNGMHRRRRKKILW